MMKCYNRLTKMDDDGKITVHGKVSSDKYIQQAIKHLYFIENDIVEGKFYETLFSINQGVYFIDNLTIRKGFITAITIKDHDKMIYVVQPSELTDDEKTSRFVKKYFLDYQIYKTEEQAKQILLFKKERRNAE